MEGRVDRAVQEIEAVIVSATMEEPTEEEEGEEIAVPSSPFTQSPTSSEASSKVSTTPGRRLVQPAPRRIQSFIARGVPDFRALHNDLSSPSPNPPRASTFVHKSLKASATLTRPITPTMPTTPTLPSAPTTATTVQMPSTQKLVRPPLPRRATFASLHQSPFKDAGSPMTPSPSRLALQRRSLVTTPQPFAMPGDKFHEKAVADIEARRRESDAIDLIPRTYKARPMPDFSRAPPTRVGRRSSPPASNV
jgi:hypothetical protein